MSSYRLRHPRRDESAAVADTVIAYEVALYGETAYTAADLEAEWATSDLDRDVWIAETDGRIVGYATLHDRGEVFRGDFYVHPEADARSIGTEFVTLLERVARERGARRFQFGVFEPDAFAQTLLAERAYRPVRVFRELRIELTSEPAPPALPEGLRFDDFDVDRDARAFHAAHQEAFADHWEHRPRSFDEWRKYHIETEKFDPTLWAVVRDEDEIAGGTINVAGLYGGGWVAALFTRRPWRGRGVGRALLVDAFRRFWERGERSVGLGVDAEGVMGAFHLYESAGMKPELGWVMYERELRDAS